MEELISKLLLARNVAHMWHWKVRSFSLHLALGELYDNILSLTDELMEMYMGAYGTDAHIDIDPVNTFSDQDPIEFIRELHMYLKLAKETIPQDGFLINKYEELQGVVSQTKYKMENLR